MSLFLYASIINSEKLYRVCKAGQEWPQIKSARKTIHVQEAFHKSSTNFGQVQHKRDCFACKSSLQSPHSMTPPEKA